MVSRPSCRFFSNFFGVAAGLLLATMSSSYVTAAERLADVAPLPGVPSLTVALPDGTSAHMYPTVSIDAARKQALGSRTLANVTYHGGRINTSTQIFTIYWKPPTLQTGAATDIPASYITVLQHMLGNYAAHAIANINTQYFQIVSGRTSYHSGLGSLGGTFTDTAAYPPSGCTDSFTPGNCINDTQIRNEVAKVMAIKGWTPGFNKVYLLFTSSGEGSCFTSATAGPGHSGS